jgi:hypothetical protein
MPTLLPDQPEADLCKNKENVAGVVATTFFNV